MAKGRKGSKRKSKEQPEAEPTHTEEETSEEGSSDLYSVLGVEKTASAAEIKKAYHRMALQLHPDKNPGDESAKEKFQTLQRVFSVLGDPEKRKVYDETGSTDDAELSGEKFNNLYEYYRTVYTKVTVEDIERFSEEYRGSEEEMKDLKELYTRFKGDMDLLFNYMICSEPSEDNHRFKEALEVAIAAGELKSYKAFKQWAANVAKTPAPTNLLKPKKRKRAEGSSNADLAAIIKSRQAERGNSLLNSLIARHGGDSCEHKRSKGKKRVAAEPDISEKEFADIQKRLLKPKKGKK